MQSRSNKEMRLKHWYFKEERKGQAAFIKDKKNAESVSKVLNLQLTIITNHMSTQGKWKQSQGQAVPAKENLLKMQMDKN